MTVNANRRVVLTTTTNTPPFLLWEGGGVAEILASQFLIPVTLFIFVALASVVAVSAS